MFFSIRPLGCEQARTGVLNDLDNYEDHMMKWVYIGLYVDEDFQNGEQNYRTAFAPELDDASELEWKPLEFGINS